MANIKSSAKRVLVSRAYAARNKADRSALKTSIKKFEAAVLTGDRTAAEAAHKAAIVIIDKAVSKGILHKNTAARKKSSLTLQLNKLA